MADSDILGLGTLGELKGFILADSMRAGTDFDAQITALGKGISTVLEQRSNRKFGYVADAVFECPANRSFICVPNYPINLQKEITVEICTGWLNGEAVWSEITNVIQNVDALAGIIYFSTFQGTHLSRLRVTYSGGYYVGDTLPDGATERPADLFLAWLLQSQNLWGVRDNLGQNVAGQNQVTFVTLTLPGYKLVPEVEAMMNQFIRYAIGG